MNANDATLTVLATAQTGSTVADTAPNAPANAGFDLIVHAVAGSGLGSSGAPYTLTISAIDLTTLTQPWPARILRQAFDPSHGWALSGTGPYYQCTQTFPITIPRHGPGGPLAGHTLQYLASLVSPGAQIASILQSQLFVLV
jgi:hypothetical protein